jgi:hypothetical protein
MNFGKPMINGEKIDLESSVRRVLILQATVSSVILVLVAGISLLFMTDNAVDPAAYLKVLGRNTVSSLYGSGLAIAGTILSARSVRRASEVARTSANLGMIPIFSGLLNKLVIVGGGIALGLIALQLAPIEMLISYIIVQFASAWTMMKPGNGTGDNS